MTKRRRRRSNPPLAARLRRYWLLVATVVVIAALGASWFVTSPSFRLQKLTVTRLAHVSRHEILAQAAIDPDANVWLVNRGAMQRRIESIPYVLYARVHRSPAAKVWIDVAERRPQGCVRDAAGETYTIDATLRVLDTGCAMRSGTRFVVRSVLAVEPGSFLDDAELQRLYGDARALGSTGQHYRAFAHDAFGELVATLADGIDVRFGDEDDLGTKQGLIGPILSQLGPRATEVRVVDLRAPATPVVEYRKAVR